MIVRHLVAKANVSPDGVVLDPRQVRHGSLRAGRVWAAAGQIDPQTHLNLDFADHRLDSCVIVEALAVGAPAVVTGDGPQLAVVAPEAFAHLGYVDVAGRRAAWLARLRERRLGVSAR